MSHSILFAVMIVLTFLGFYFGRSQATGILNSGATGKLHSLPFYHGAFLAFAVLLPAMGFIITWLVVSPMLADHYMAQYIPGYASMDAATLGLKMSDVRNMANGGITSGAADEATQIAADFYVRFNQISLWLLSIFSVIVAIGSFYYGRKLIALRFRARNHVEKIVRVIMIVASMIAILTTLGIVLSLIFETMRFLQKVPLADFLFGLKWSPQTAMRPGQVGSSGAFGMLPLLAGTFLITLIAMTVAVPIGLYAAIYMSEYATPRIRGIAKPVLEVLAGIPTVVYGFFAALTVAPMLRDFGVDLGLVISAESALAAGLVMGVMIIPFVSSLSDDVINSVPQTLRDGAYALGATKSETIKQVVLPAALPGIVGSVLLAVSRAVGETMIVVMAAGLAANLTANPFEAVTTVTVQIVTLLVGDQEFDSAKTLAAFALGLVLFIITLGLNVIALYVVRRYREQYD